MCTVEQLASAGNYRALLASLFLEWSPPSNAQRPRPVRLTPPAPAQKPPPLEIVPDPDVVRSLRLTYARRVEVNGGDYGRARDEIESDPAGGKLFQLAARVFAERQSKRIPGASLRRAVTGLYGESA